MSTVVILCLSITILVLVSKGRGPRPGGKVALCPPPPVRSVRYPPTPPSLRSDPGWWGFR